MALNLFEIFDLPIKLPLARPLLSWNASRRVGGSRAMSHDQTVDNRPAWRRELPVLQGPTVALREPTSKDIGPVIDLLSTSDATPFGIDDEVGDVSAMRFIERAIDDRGKGVACTFLATLTVARTAVGLIQVRALDPVFETAEWEGLLAPSVRGTGLFLEAARLVGSFAFDTLGSHRLESRVLVQNARAHGAMRKLGAAQEGVLRRSLRRDGQYFDQVLWSVLKEDWAALRVSIAPWVH